MRSTAKIHNMNTTARYDIEDHLPDRGTSAEPGDYVQVEFSSPWTPPHVPLQSLMEVVHALNERLPDFVYAEGYCFSLQDSGWLAGIDFGEWPLWCNEDSVITRGDGDPTYDEIFDHCIRKLKQIAEWLSGIADNSWNTKHSD